MADGARPAGGDISRSDLAAGPPRPIAFPRARRGFLDPGWLYVVAGVLLIGATVLVPAADDLEEARFLRARAELIKQHRDLRLDRYRGYLNALDAPDRTLAVSLAATQLNQIPADRRPIDDWPDRRAGDASIFPALEPPPLTLPDRRRVDSALMRWSTDERARLWLLAGGTLLVMLGLLPRSSRTPAEWSPTANPS